MTRTIAFTSSLTLLIAGTVAQTVVYPMAAPRANHAVVAGSDAGITNRMWGGVASDGAQMFVFGGRTSPSGSAGTTYYNGLYGYDPVANAWTTLSAESDPNAPSARFRCAMAHDPIGNRIVIYGGGNHVAAAIYSDCYAFDLGTNTWSQIANPTPGTTGPQPLYDCRMAFDATSGNLVLFGGQNVWGDGNVNNRVADTWLLSGTTWTQVTGLTEGVDVPSARRMHLMAARSAPYADVVVTRGQGNGGNTVRPDDTWRWNGTTSTWSQVSGANSSVPVTWGAGNDMVYDSVREALVIIGGPGTGVAPSTTTGGGAWNSEFDCVTNEWRAFGVSTTSQATEDPVIGKLQRCHVAFANGKVLIWGGQNSSSTGDADLTKIKEYQANPVASATSYGTGCGGLSLAAGSAPWGGRDWTLTASGYSGTAIGAVMISVAPANSSLPAPGMAGCSLLVDANLALATVLLVPSAGTASFTAAMPLDASLGGLPLNSQVFSFDAGVVTSSNGIAGLLGAN